MNKEMIVSFSGSSHEFLKNGIDSSGIYECEYSNECPQQASRYGYNDEMLCLKHYILTTAELA